VETKLAHLRLPHQEWRLQQGCFKESYIQHCYPSPTFVQRSWDGDARLWLTLMPFMPVNNFCSFLCFDYVLNVACNTPATPGLAVVTLGSYLGSKTSRTN
jgi:hypothetical protein